jgi:hypothetical protein
MSAESEFFLGSKSSVVLIETLEISHPSFGNADHAFYIVRNVAAGFSVNVPDKSQTVNFIYYPVKISRIGIQQNMDQAFNITVGDLGDLLNEEMQRVEEANTFHLFPEVTYRAWRSDYLAAPLYGPIKLEIVNVNTKGDAATFEAKAPRLNINGTGELYTLNRFPMLRGSL